MACQNPHADTFGASPHGVPFPDPTPGHDDLDSHPGCRQTWSVNLGHSARWSVWEAGRFSNTIAQAEMYAPHEADMTAKGSSE